MGGRPSATASQIHALSSGLLSDDPVAHSAAAYAGRTACIDIATGHALTYAELNERIDRCTGLLRQLIGEVGSPGTELEFAL